ncbi:hypothetical protein MMC18_007409 [Xylographa bjoerkii]|nr:hypothetical protein [Xylographa bjoerkii]
MFTRLRHTCSPTGFREDQSTTKLADIWTIEELLEVLLLVATNTTCKVNICLFVDALDEHDGNHRDLISMLKRLVQLTGTSFFRIRLCLAGRPENVFKDAFQSCPGFAVHEHTTKDIKLYAEGRIHDGLGGALTDEGQRQLKFLTDNIVEKAQGVFMWVKLVVNELIEGLCEGDSIEELRELLSTIPTELEELYIRAIQRPRSTSCRILRQHRHEAYIMFQIAIYARRPFGLYDFVAATLFLITQKGASPEFQSLSIDQLHRRLNSRSAGLLESTTNGVQFIHQTVKEFMSTGKGKQAISGDLLDWSNDSGFLLIYRYLLGLLVDLLSDERDIYEQKFLHSDFEYYAQEVDSESGICAGQYLDMSISKFQECEAFDVLRQLVTYKHGTNWASVFSLMRHGRHAYLLLFYVLYGLPRSLGERISSHKGETIDPYSYEILKAAIDARLAACPKHLPFCCLEILLQAGLGASLSAAQFSLLDERSGGALSLSTTNERGQRLWDKLREEKTSKVSSTSPVLSRGRGRGRGKNTTLLQSLRRGSPNSSKRRSSR